MKKNAVPELDAAWWRKNQATGLAGAKDLDKALEEHEKALARLQASGLAADEAACGKALDDIDAAVKKLKAETAKTLKNPPNGKSGKFDEEDMRHTGDALGRYEAVIAAARKQAAALVKTGVYANPDEYAADLKAMLSKARHGPMQFAFGGGSKPAEHRLALHHATSGSSLANALRNQTSLKKFGIGTAHMDPTRATALVLAFEGAALPGANAKFQALRKLFGPLPFDRVVVQVGGVEVADVADPDDEADAAASSTSTSATPTSAAPTTGTTAAGTRTTGTTTTGTTTSATNPSTSTGAAAGGIPSSSPQPAAIPPAPPLPPSSAGARPSASTASAGASSSPAPADPALDPLRSALKALSPDISAALAARPDARPAVMAQIEAVKGSLAAGRADDARASLDKLRTLLARTASSASSSAPSTAPSSAPAAGPTAAAAAAPGSPSPAAAAGPGLAAWQRARNAAVAQLNQLGAAIAASKDPQARAALIQLKAIGGNLTPSPAHPQGVAELERYLRTDDVLVDVEVPNPFGIRIAVREPLLAALGALKAEMSH